MSQPPQTRSPQGMLQDQIGTLADKFLKRTADEVRMFQEQLAAFAQGDRSVLPSIGAVAHKIHGSGAVFGFERISDAAGVLERLIEDIDREITSADVAATAQHSTRLRDAIEQLARIVSEERAPAQ